MIKNAKKWNLLVQLLEFEMKLCGFEKNEYLTEHILIIDLCVTSKLLAKFV